MKNGVKSCRGAVYTLFVVAFLSICLTSIVGNAEMPQEARIQDESYFREDRAARFLEPFGWSINYVKATQDFILPISLIPNIDQEETIYWAVVNECSKIAEMDLTPYLGKAIQTTEYNVMEQGYISSSAVFIIEHEGEIVGAFTLFYGIPESITRIRTTAQIDELLENTIPSSYIPEVDQSDPLEVATAYLDAKVNEDAETALALTDIIYIYNNLIWYHDDMLIMGTPLRTVYQSSDIKQVLSFEKELTYSTQPENERYYEYIVEYAVDDGDGFIRTLVVSLVEDKGIWKVRKLSEFL